MWPGPLGAQVNRHLLNSIETLAEMAFNLRCAVCIYVL